jgi:hypothetical protein
MPTLFAVQFPKNESPPISGLTSNNRASNNAGDAAKRHSKPEGKHLLYQ